MYQRKILLNPALSVSVHTILIICLYWNITAYGDAKSELDALTGGIHSRVAWREGGHQIKGGSNLVKGFDSKTGQIHTIWSGESCVKPVMCSQGNRVLITTSKHQVYVIDWDGKNKKLVVKSGMCSDAWVDPATGKEWCVYRPGGTSRKGGVTRCLISDPTTTVRMWNGKEGHPVYPWFQMSADGKRGASFLTNKTAGALNIETGEVSWQSGGCWASMASDNSYIWFHMQGKHKSVAVYKDQTKIGSVSFMPPIKGGQMYCDRAAEGPEHGGRFFTVSGGYPGYNKNGKTVEAFVGKFGEGFKSVEGWARITNNNQPDHHPTAWIGVVPPGSNPTNINAANRMSPPSISRKAWSVIPDKSGGFNLFISKAGSYDIRVLKTDGTLLQKFTCRGNSWHMFRINHGPGVFLMQIGTDKKNVRQLYIIQ